MNLIEDLVHFLHHLGRAHPELALRVAQALCLYFFDLNDSEVSLLTPLKLFVQKVEHCEVKTPHVVTACQIDVVVRVETGEGDGAAEVSILSLGHRLVLTVQVLLGQAEVHNVHLSVFTIEHEV